MGSCGAQDNHFLKPMRHGLITLGSNFETSWKKTSSFSSFVQLRLKEGTKIRLQREISQNGLQDVYCRFFCRCFAGCL